MLFERFRKKKNEMLSLPKQVDLFREDIIDLTKSINNVFQEVNNRIDQVQKEILTHDNSIKDIISAKPIELTPKDIKALQLSFDSLKRSVDSSMKEFSTKYTDIEAKVNECNSSLSKLNKEVEKLAYIKPLVNMLSEVYLTKTDAGLNGVFFTQNSKEAKKDSVSVTLPNGTSVYLKNL